MKALSSYLWLMLAHMIPKKPLLSLINIMKSSFAVFSLHKWTNWDSCDHNGNCRTILVQAVSSLNSYLPHCCIIAHDKFIMWYCFFSHEIFNSNSLLTTICTKLIKTDTMTASYDFLLQNLTGFVNCVVNQWGWIPISV